MYVLEISDSHKEAIQLAKNKRNFKNVEQTVYQNKRFSHNM